VIIFSNQMVRKMRKSHEERKEEIIHATLDLAATDNKIKKITTQAIADTLGISQPTIFKHFKTSDKLFSAVFEWVASKIFNGFDKILSNKDDTPDIRLDKLIKAQLSFIANHPGVPRLIFSNQVYHGSAKLKTVVQTLMAQYNQTIKSLIIEGIESGHYRATLNPKDTATLISTTMQGLLVRWSIHDFNFDIEQEGILLLLTIKNNLDFKG